MVNFVRRWIVVESSNRQTGYSETILFGEYSTKVLGSHKYKEVFILTVPTVHIISK